MIRRRWRVLVLLGALLASLWAGSGVALAHARLIRSTPLPDAVLQQQPRLAHLWFSEDLNGTSSHIVVLDRSGHHMELGQARLVPGQTRQLEIGLATLHPGSYLVLWTSVSAEDGHVQRGSYLFSMLVRGPGPALPGAFTSGGGESPPDAPTAVSLLAHWIELLAVTVWAGAACLSLLVFAPVLRGQDPALQEAERTRTARLVVVALALLAGASTVVIVLQTYGVAGNDWSAVFTPATLSGVFTAQYGKLWIVRQVMVLLTLPVVFRAISLGRNQRAGRAPVRLATASSLVYLYLLAASGHASSVDIGSLQGNHQLSAAVVVDWFHLLADSLWLGGQIAIALVLIPALPLRSGAYTTPFLAALARFSPFAYGAIALYTLSGGFNGKVHIATWYAYFHSVYGWTLTVKIGLIGIMMAISVYTVFLLRPRIYAAQREERVDRVGPLVTRLGSWLRINPLVGAGVLFATSVMFYYPVPLGLAPPGPSTYSIKGGGLTARVALKPNHSGPNQITVTLTDRANHPVSRAHVVILTTMLDMVMGTGLVTLTPGAPGTFNGSADLGMGGHWRLQVLVYQPAPAPALTRLSVVAEVGR